MVDLNHICNVLGVDPNKYIQKPVKTNSPTLSSITDLEVFVLYKGILLKDQSYRHYQHDVSDIADIVDYLTEKDIKKNNKKYTDKICGLKYKEHYIKSGTTVYFLRMPYDKLEIQKSNSFMQGGSGGMFGRLDENNPVDFNNLSSIVRV
jgi:hypothetical protein